MKIIVCLVITWLLLGCGKSATPDPFAEFQKRDWYEDRKRQEQIKAHSDFIAAWIKQKNADDPRPSGSEKFQQIVATERDAHLRNHVQLSQIASKMLAAKSEPEYRVLKTDEDKILYEIETQAITDRNDVADLRLHSSELEADLLELEQRYQQ